VVAARTRSQRALDRLPSDADVDFSFRNGSAFQIQATKEKKGRSCRSGQDLPESPKAE